MNNDDAGAVADCYSDVLNRKASCRPEDLDDQCSLYAEALDAPPRDKQVHDSKEEGRSAEKSERSSSASFDLMSRTSVRIGG